MSGTTTSSAACASPAPDGRRSGRHGVGVRGGGGGGGGGRVGGGGVAEIDRLGEVLAGGRVEDVQVAGVDPELGALALDDLGGGIESGDDLVAAGADVGPARVAGQLLELGALGRSTF